MICGITGEVKTSDSVISLACAGSLGQPGLPPDSTRTDSGFEAAVGSAVPDWSVDSWSFTELGRRLLDVYAAVPCSPPRARGISLWLSGIGLALAVTQKS